MSSNLIKPIASIFIEPLIEYAKTLGLDSNLIIKDIWDRKSKWVEADDWGLAASRLENLSGDPLACYHASFNWVTEILNNDTPLYDSKLVIGRTYTLEKEYIGDGVLRITMHHAPKMEPPRSGVLFNLGGLNGIAKNNNIFGKAILIESQCEELPPIPEWHPSVLKGDSDIFEIY
jgi:hypothetical protein